jgi:hypothetical protein
MPVAVARRVVPVPAARQREELGAVSGGGRLRGRLRRGLRLLRARGAGGGEVRGGQRRARAHRCRKWRENGGQQAHHDDEQNFDSQES